MAFNSLFMITRPSHDDTNCCSDWKDGSELYFSNAGKHVFAMLNVCCDPAANINCQKSWLNFISAFYYAA